MDWIKNILADLTGKQKIGIVVIVGCFILIGLGNNHNVHTILLLTATYFFTKEKDRKK